MMDSNSRVRRRPNAAEIPSLPGRKSRSDVDETELHVDKVIEQRNSQLTLNENLVFR